MTPPAITGPVTFLELEITGRCQLRCRHCYASSGPEGGHGSMTADDWEQVIDQACAAGITSVQFIGGEPIMHPDLPRLIRYALGRELSVDVYSNLVHVSDELWRLFVLPGVSLGVSWYSARSEIHAKITGTPGSHARTRANVAKAVRMGITVRAGIVEVVDGQDLAAARADLEALGVVDIKIDRARGVGRAAATSPTVDELCGNCGKGRAAVGGDGAVSPCVIGRFLVAGNVKTESLGQILNGQRWRDIVASVPPLDRCTPMGCTPSDGNDCNPSV